MFWKKIQFWNWGGKGHVTASTVNLTEHTGMVSFQLRDYSPDQIALLSCVFIDNGYNEVQPTVGGTIPWAA